VNLDAQLNMSIEVHTHYLIPDGASLSASAKVKATAGLDATLSGSQSWEIGEIDSSPIDIQAGPVPIILVPKIPVFLSVSGQISVGVEASMTVGASMSWSSENSGTLNTNNLTTRPHMDGSGPLPGVSATAAGTVELQVQPQIGIYDAAGPNVEADADLTADVNFLGSPYFTLTPSITLKAGLDFDILDGLFHGSLEVTLGTFDFPAFVIESAPNATLAISPANPTVTPGTPTTFTTTRSDGKTYPVTWSLKGAATGDSITSGGVLTTVNPTGRTLTVIARDSTGAIGETTVTVGTAFDAPGNFTAVPTESGTGATLTWTAPVSTGGSALAGYTIFTQPVTSTMTLGADATDATLSGLDPTATYVVSIYAHDQRGLQSPEATATLNGPGNSTGPWTPTEAPLPANTVSQDVFLDSVACTGAGSCVAVGRYDTSDQGIGLQLIETLANGTWTPTEAPLPANAASDSEQYAGGLYTVVCAGAGSCVAVGQYVDTSENIQGLIETLANGTWTPTEAPLPANAVSQDVYLKSVVCTGAGSCIAIGEYSVTSENNQGVIETLANGTWTPTEAPLPANATASFLSQLAGLYSIVCTGAGSCIAIGGYRDTNDNPQGLIETLADGTWTPREAPLPTNAAVSNQNAGLDSIVCTGAGSCVAMGGYADTSSDGQGLIETLADGTWTPSEAPVPANAASESGAYPVSISCTGSGFCAAVGSYSDTSDDQQGLIETN
jgi:chemotaxis receptor (MCP) glutamine deamidase CheD